MNNVIIVDTPLVPLLEKDRERFFRIRYDMTDTNWANNKRMFSLTDIIQVSFPVLDGTPYSREDLTISPLWVEYLYNYGQNGVYYDERCQYLIDNFPTRNMFKEHSLFLLKESLKTFSPYSDKAKELLIKLESLEQYLNN